MRSAALPPVKRNPFTEKASLDVSRESLGLLLGFVGVCVFAGTLPFTRIAVEHLSPGFITTGRAATSGLIAAALLIALRRPLPDRSTIWKIALASLALVGGFPIFTALAMQSVPAGHGGVVLGILPLATALLSTLIAGERPGPAFWIAAVVGAALVVGFTVRAGGGGLGSGDLFLFGAVAASSLGYVISAQLARGGLRGWEVISWLLVVALPVTLPFSLWLMPAEPGQVPAWSWIGFAYVSLMSQYLGFFAWNAGLALGGIARVSQVQLLQTFITLVIAAMLNRESIAPLTWVVAVAVVALVLAARRSAIHRR
jgi:drug/metabolite transporter (DMT)-like permease